MLLFGRIVGRETRARALVRRFRAGLETRHSRRIRVYFEEWPEPLISGIGWVSELIERAATRRSLLPVGAVRRCDSMKSASAPVGKRLRRYGSNASTKWIRASSCSPGR